MKKRTQSRVSVLYVNISPENHKWIKRQMKKFNYTATRGKSEFLDSLFTALRTKHAATKAKAKK